MRNILWTVCNRLKVNSSFNDWSRFDKFKRREMPIDKQDAVGDGRLRPGVATWRARPNNVIWRPTGVATWRTGRNIRVVFDSPSFLHCVKTRRHPQNRKCITYRIAVREDWATATGIMHRKFDEIWTCRFWNMRADTQTNRQTEKYIHADHNTSPTCRRRSNSSCCCLATVW